MLIRKLERFIGKFLSVLKESMIVFGKIIPIMMRVYRSNDLRAHVSLEKV
jgi:hypothetical protein